MNRVPEPAVVRSALVSISAVIAIVAGYQMDSELIEQIVTAYAAVSALIAGFLIRPAVTPVKGKEE